MITARGLGRRFGSLVAVEDISLRVADGMLLALLGPNGAGKTTTVRMLSGLLSASEGSASVAGCDVTADPAAVRARIGLVTDVPGLYEQMTPRGYLQFFGRLYGLEPQATRRRIDELLAMFELDNRATDRMVTFSRGMQQKVALARALLHEPSVLFLDEPTAGLDPLAARGVRELIQSLKHARRSIVLCTHDLDEAERLADEVAIMRAGRIVALDAPSELRQRASPETLVTITLAEPRPTAPNSVIIFRTSEPRVENPRVVRHLVADGAEIVSVTCTTQTLEDVYASAVNGSPPPAVRAAMLASDGWLAAPHASTPTPASPPPRDGAALLLIARRAAIESLNDRMTRIMNVGLAVLAPIGLLLLVIKPLESTAGDLIGSVLPLYLLVIGLMPAVGAVGIAAGQFAGEKERGVLTPTLASPASNLAIFGGKVLGAVVPPVLYSVVAEAIYLSGIVLLLGADRLALLPAGLSIGLLLMVPAATTLAATVGALVSSRVRTFNAAQQISGVILIPLWAALFAVVFLLEEWGSVGIFATLLATLAIDAGLVVVAARTWQREEVLSQR